jgi:hypothetical protein
MAPLLILIAIKILAEIGLMAEEQPVTVTVAKPKP